MIHAVGKNEKGDPLLVLALEPGNIERLKKEGGDPITVRIEDYFPEGVPRKLQLVIHYTETPVADFRKMRSGASWSFDERTPRNRALPHCPECKSTIEQLGVFKNESPITLVMCPTCGCTLGTMAKGGIEGSV